MIPIFESLYYAWKSHRKTTQFSLDRQINRPCINAQYEFAEFYMHFLNSYII